MWLTKRLKVIVPLVFRVDGPLWILGLVTPILAILIEPHGESASGIHRFFGAALSHVAVALIVGALLVSIEKAVFFHELREELVRLLRLSEAMSASGIADAATADDRHYDGFRDLISTSDRLTVVVNYGKDWMSDWRQLLATRLNTSGKETNWFLLDPQSPFVAILADKQARAVATGATDPTDFASAVREKIEETIRQLKHAYMQSEQKGTLRIYTMPAPLFPTVSIYLGENPHSGKVIITFYTVSSHKGAVPLVTFERDPLRRNIFTFFQEDVGRLRTALQPIWVSPPPVEPSPLEPSGTSASKQ